MYDLLPRWVYPNYHNLVVDAVLEMTARELLRRFPNCSKSTLQANYGKIDPETVRPGKAPELERDAEPDSLGEARLQKATPGKFLVRVTSVATRLLDEDNCCEKFHVDILRYAGCLPSDAPGKATIQTFQRKCLKGEEPHTEIEVYEIT